MPSDKMFALVDCNNFYASCERVFNPALKNRPVVVLSNNDGCIVARSQEAKDLGMAMATPIFKCWDFVKQHDVRVFSSNYVLYGDISNRVMSLLSRMTPHIEVYSIDEAFLSCDGMAAGALADYGRQIQQRIKRATGIPVSVGIAATKTLAKVANYFAKHQKDKGGVLCLTRKEDIEHYLCRLPLEKVWGIARRKAAFLQRNNIQDVLQLTRAPDRWIKKYLTVMTLRTVWELRGISCIPLEEVSAHKKGIGTSRSFGRDVTKFSEMQEALAAYTARAAVKLRAQALLAGYIQVFIATDVFKEERPYYQNTSGMCLDPPSADTARLIKSALCLFQGIFRRGLIYKRAGIMLMDLSPQDCEQGDLFERIYQHSARRRLMDVMDRYNARTNSGKLFWAAEGLGKPWSMRQAYTSGRYTTRWEELLKIKI